MQEPHTEAEGLLSDITQEIGGQLNLVFVSTPPVTTLRTELVGTLICRHRPRRMNIGVDSNGVVRGGERRARRNPWRPWQIQPDGDLWHYHDLLVDALGNPGHVQLFKLKE